jgi:hypothetical protein
MRLRQAFLAVTVLATALAASGCKHVLVPDPGNPTVSVYEDEEIYTDTLNLEKQAQDPTMQKVLYFINRMLAMAKTERREVDGDTRVKIISSDAKGSVVEVLEGKYLGYQGFVPKENLR